MNETSNVVRGILHPDGTLELAERPTLPAGDVEVTIRPVVSEAPKETLWEYRERTRTELEASGATFRTKEEIDADLADDRDWGEDRLEEIYRQSESGRSTLPAEPTELTNQPATGEPPKETLWEAMQRSRAELEASGHDFFRTKEEVDAYIEDLRDWGEDKIETTTPTAEGYGPYLARIRARREAEGFPFRTKDEIDAEVEEFRSWGEASEAPRQDEGHEAQH